jgi:hypothetical protein
MLLPAAVFATPEDRARGEEVSKAHITVLGLTIGRDTLKDAAERLGPAKVFQSGPAGAASFRICYTSTDERDSTKVVFEAGPQSLRREITSIRIIRGDVVYRDAARCAKSPLVSSDAGTLSGLRLGMTRQALKARLGEPTEESKKTLEYEFHTRRRLSKAEVRRLAPTWPYVRKYPYFDVYSSVVARFHEGRLVRLVLSRIETR